MLIYLLLFVLFLIIIDIFISYMRNQRRSNTYKDARNYSYNVKKPLLVIGNPSSGFWNKNILSAYGCGDLCTDLIGCEGCPNFIKGDILNVLTKLKTNQYVIFESCVMEYIDKENQIKIKEQINRVSGGDYYQVRIGPHIFPVKHSLSEFGF